MRRKILFVIDSLNCGGAEKSLVSLLSLLDKGKYDISLYSIHRGGVFEYLVPKWVKWVNPHYTLLERIRLKTLGIVFSLAIRLNRFRLRKVHLSEIYWKYCGAGVKFPEDKFDIVIAYQQGLPTYLVATRSTADKKYCWINADIKKAGYSPDFCRIFYRRYTGIVAVSDALKQMLSESFLYGMDNKMTTVYDILNPRLIREMAVESVNAEHGGRLVLVTVGRMVYPKGYDLAVEAATQLRKSGVVFKWYFVGGGGMMPEIKKCIAERHLEDYIELVGETINPYPYMQMADIYVQTSRFEGFGLTVSEAKILHKPIVSTNFPSAYNQIEPERNGLICEMTGKEIAEAIKRLIDTPQLRESLVAALKVEENVTYLTEVRKVEALLKA